MRKISDLAGGGFFLCFTLLLFSHVTEFMALTKAYPYLMGFAKVSILATFGECLRHRLAKKSWLPDRIGWRFLVWGLFGVWFAAAFPYADAGTRTIVDGEYSTLSMSFLKSLWINILGGYGFSMMATHYWTDNVIADGFCWPWELTAKEETKRWAKVICLTLLFFWIPAHTLTFCLAPEWRILCVAYMSICLGVILSFANKK